MPSVGGLPSVTEILADVGLSADYRAILGSKQQYYSERGRALHLAIQYYHEGLLKPEEGVLNETTLHPLVKPGFLAYKRFLEETGHLARHTELEMIHEEYKFCGHLDREGELTARSCLIDFKYSDSPDLEAARYQLAGYDILYRHRFPRGPVPERRYVLALSPSGRGSGYMLHDVTDDLAIQTFVAALMVYQAKRRRR
jgi:hypothetical protein